MDFPNDLKYNDSKEIQEIIGNDIILYNNRLIKLNKYNISREIDLIVTKESIYILKKKSMQINFNNII